MPCVGIILSRDGEALPGVGKSMPPDKGTMPRGGEPSTPVGDFILHVGEALLRVGKVTTPVPIPMPRVPGTMPRGGIFTQRVGKILPRGGDDY
jgi:hypothetical protein